MSSPTAGTKAGKRKRPRGGLAVAAGTPRRVAIYMRRSTDDEHQPFSLDAQRAALDKYIGSQPGWTIVAEYEDDASGATTDRPGLRKPSKPPTPDSSTSCSSTASTGSAAASPTCSTSSTNSKTPAYVLLRHRTLRHRRPLGRMMLQLFGVFAEFERETSSTG